MIALGALVWLALSVLSFRTMADDYYRRFRCVTRGDIAFIALMASAGPFVFPILITIWAGDKPTKFFKKEVRRKSERTGA